MYEFRKQIKREYAMLIVIAVAFAILVAPYAVRMISGNDTFIGSESYYNVHRAGLVSGNLMISHESLSYGGQPVVLNPYHMLLSAVSSVAGIGLASKVIPFILGILSAILFYIIVKKMGLSENKAFLSTLFFITSPIFIYIFTVSSHFALLIFLNLLGLNLFMKNGRHYYLSLVCYFIIALFGIFDVIASLFVLLIYSIYYRKDKTRLYILIFLLALWSFMHKFLIFSEIGMQKMVLHSPARLLGEFFTVLGADYGFSIFMLYLVISGIMISWKKKKEYYPIFISMLIFMIASLVIGPYTNIYLNMAFSAFAGVSVFRLIRRPWDLARVRDYLIYIIVLGVFFSSIMQLSSLAFMDPSMHEYEILGWFDNKGQGVVLSHPKNSQLLKSISGKVPLLEGNEIYDYYGYSDTSPEMASDADMIFHSRSLDEAIDLLDKWHIRYIYIDQEMKQSLVWDGKREELLFLLRNQETFKRLYNYENIEIYEYLRWQKE